jgi:hypothetical protein
MKKFFTIAAFSLCAALLAAQGADFAPVGAKWYYSELNFALKTIPHIIESVGKEDYQGKWCSKLVSSSNDIVPNPAYVYTENDTVYYFSPISGQFEMLYDFTAEVGDSWVVGGLEAFDLDGNLVASDTVTVDSISLLSVNGQDLKVRHISHSFWFDWGGLIIEKVGNDKLFMPKRGIVEAKVWGLRCFDSPEFDFQLVPYPCDTVFNFSGSSVSEQDASLRLLASPNPATTHTYLSWEHLIEGSTCKLSLFDGLGRLVREQALTMLGGQPLRVELSSLPPGAYAYRVVTDAGKLGVGIVLLGR